MKTFDLGNNETKSRGIEQMPSGEWLALTLAESKTFKTRAGAVRWLAKRGYDENGERIN